MATRATTCDDCTAHRRCGLRTCAKWPIIVIVTPDDIDPTPTPEELAAQEEMVARNLMALADAYERSLGPEHPQARSARRAAESLRRLAADRTSPTARRETPPPRQQECP